ncbi:TIGR02452 family protein [Hymenobacter crusticola]|uniref:TIGR02452 family protein n=1 Tax=Hymenobacter crusticola TaxID=1770526 RepID=A0A243WEW2_9BACT|nr:TIGR02452 family protein [Hymenobacter crusticola]OUJ74274.1 TIGR02452 family protein [Hymenobacter crusticola]
MNREQRQQAAIQTIEALKQGYYCLGSGEKVDIRTWQTAAERASALHRPADVPEVLRVFEQPAGEPAEVRVYNATTLEATTNLRQQFVRVACLNFASARNPGGGFLGGSQAQEESLTRSSGLYQCIAPFSEMYWHNSQAGSTGLYSDYAIYSPNVPVLRDDSGAWLEQPYQVDFITAPAVNAGALHQNAPQLLPQLAPVMKQRIRLVLALAARHRCEALVLGAWGCGVFGNDPLQIATLFAEALAEPSIRGQFQRIDFAVFDSRPPYPTLRAFEQALGPLT